MEQINNRIAQLEQIERDRSESLSLLRIELATKQAESKVIQEKIDSALFEKTEEFKELTELRIAQKVLERMV